jgi:hypothetical protein
MKSLQECYLDSFFSRVDAGELIALPFDVRCSGCREGLSRCPFKRTPRFRSDETCYWNPSATFSANRPKEVLR